MKFPTILAITALILFASAPVTSAQSSESTLTLWMHQGNNGACCQSWTSFEKEDEKANLDGTSNLGMVSDGELGGTAIPTPTGGTITPLRAENVLRYPLTPSLEKIIELDLTKTIHSVVFVGGAEVSFLNGVPGPPNAGAGEIFVALKLGNQTIAEGERHPGDYTMEWLKIEDELTPLISTLDPAVGNLVWEIHWIGVAPSFGVSSSDTNGHSHFALPLAPPAPSRTFEEDSVSGLDFALSGTSSQQESKTLTVKWSTTANSFDLKLDASIGAGSLNVKATNPAGETIYQNMAVANVTDALRLVDQQPGEWTIIVNSTDFTGDYSLKLTHVVVKVVQSASSTTSTTQSSTTSSSEESTTTSSTASPVQASLPKKSPGFGAISMAGILGLLLVRRRLS